MSSSGFSSPWIPRGELGCPPVLLPASMPRGPFPGVCPLVFDCRTWVPAPLLSPLNSPKFAALLLP